MADLSGSHSRFDSLVQDVRSIILIKRSEAERSVDFHRVATYWKVGQRIVERSKEARTGLHMGQGSSIGLRRGLSLRVLFSALDDWTLTRGFVFSQGARE